MTDKQFTQLRDTHANMYARANNIVDKKKSDEFMNALDKFELTMHSSSFAVAQHKLVAIESENSDRISRSNE